MSHSNERDPIKNRFDLGLIPFIAPLTWGHTLKPEKTVTKLDASGNVLVVIQSDDAQGIKCRVKKNPERVIQLLHAKPDIKKPRRFLSGAFCI